MLVTSHRVSWHGCKKKQFHFSSGVLQIDPSGCFICLVVVGFVFDSPAFKIFKEAHAFFAPNCRFTTSHWFLDPFVFCVLHNSFQLLPNKLKSLRACTSYSIENYPHELVSSINERYLLETIQAGLVIYLAEMLMLIYIYYISRKWITFTIEARRRLE